MCFFWIVVKLNKKHKNNHGIERLLLSMVKFILNMSINLYQTQMKGNLELAAVEVMASPVLRTNVLQSVVDR